MYKKFEKALLKEEILKINLTITADNNYVSKVISPSVSNKR